MEKKASILKVMQEELDHAHRGNREPLIGENYMTVEYVYHRMKETFEKVFIPEHILDIFMTQDFPLYKMYEYFVDHDYFNRALEWNAFIKEYASDVEFQHVAEKLHDKIETEYRAVMHTMADRPPYRMDEVLSEIRFMMLAFGLFRYDECFTLEEMNLLLGTLNILTRAFKYYQGDLLMTKDEHDLQKVTLECLGKVVADERGTTVTEEDALEV